MSDENLPRIVVEGTENDGPDTIKIFIDDREIGVPNANVTQANGRLRVSGKLEDFYAIEKLKMCTFSHLHKYMESIYFPLHVLDEKFKNHKNVGLNYLVIWILFDTDLINEKYVYISIEPMITSKDDDDFFRLSEFYHRLKYKILSLEIPRIEWHESFDSVPPVFDISIKLNNVSDKLGDLFQFIDVNLSSVLVEAYASPFDKFDKRSVSYEFEFPPEIHTSCSQYLLYFSQFLHDLGIEASADLYENAGKTLFSVTPKSRTEALERIREALFVYLNLPERSDELLFSLSGTDQAVIQLKSQVQFLNAQLGLAQATIQAKDAAIEHHRATAQLLRPQALDGREMLSHLEFDQKGREILGGVITVSKATKLRDWGIEQIDWAKAIDKLKSLLKRNRS
tara:strand:+ start:395 stop:1582 length:1188 start_codon:yes stop_codon:yes gene_type:complete